LGYVLGWVKGTVIGWGVSIPSREGALYESHLGMLRIALCSQYTQHTQRDRSRGIRDEATACEPEVVSRERTWPPLPVAQPSRATERPFGTKYNIDQNKAKKEGPGGARGQTGSRNMAATRFFDSATPTSYLTSNTSQCLSHTVTQFYSVNVKSRPKYTTTSRFPNPLHV